jgi:uncharacterized membrane protein YdjX (TVP38/TMEM64 family)
LSTETGQGENGGRPTRDLLKFFLVGLVFLGLALAIRQGMGSDSQQWLLEVRQFLQGSEFASGLWVSSACFIFIASAAISLGVPRLWISGAAGAIYGVLLGMVLAMIASVIGAITVYLL